MSHAKMPPSVMVRSLGGDQVAPRLSLSYGDFVNIIHRFVASISAFPRLSLHTVHLESFALLD